MFFVEHRIHVVEERCHTQSYSYRIQHAPDRSTWLVRWEYLREPPNPEYPYPLGHLHLNAEWVGDNLASPIDKSLERLHLATGRVAFELVLWQLIAEWGAASRTEGWRRFLQDSIDGFEVRRRAP